MKTVDETSEYFWKVSKMGAASKVDLRAAMREGLLSEADVAAAVSQCQSCPEPEACRAWLRQGDPDSAPPAYCRNGPLWTELTAD